MTERINLGILAHVDAGKTTVTEQLLYLSGQLRQVGSVDKGTTQTDFIDAERRRGISVRTATTELQWKNIRINIIDTPGHMDFAAEAERALRVLDAAVIILSAVEGVKARTELLWKAALNLGLPVMFFINKLDRTGADVEAVIAQIHAVLTEKTVLLQGLVDPSMREGLLQAVAELDDDVMLQYMEGKEVPDKRIRGLLRQETGKGQIYPILFGSALKGWGMSGLLDAITELFPRAQGEEDGEVSGVVFKMEHDKGMGRLAHVRLYSGTLRSRDLVYNATNGSEEKISQIRKFFGNKYEDTGIQKAGDIAALCGLSHTRAGDNRLSLLGGCDAGIGH